MHYLIVKWDPENLRYDIIHYTHDHTDLLRMIEKYPRANGYQHMVELAYTKAHDVNEAFERWRVQPKQPILGDKE